MPYKVLAHFKRVEKRPPSTDKQSGFLYPVIKVVYNSTNTYRATILQKQGNVYTYHIEMLYYYSDEELALGLKNDGNMPCWIPYTHRASYFDTIERAEQAIFEEAALQKSTVLRGT